MKPPKFAGKDMRILAIKKSPAAAGLFNVKKIRISCTS
jgi:hypothetical protein